MVTLPEEGAVQNHHTEAPPAFAIMFGSPVSLLAPTLEPVTVAEVPLINVALAKLLLASPPEVAAAWLTVKLLPAMVKVPEREDVAVLPATE